MAWCQSPFVLLACLFLMTAAKPVDRILSKRDTGAHQIVEVPQAPLAIDLSEKDVKSQKAEDDDRPVVVVPPALASSSEMVQDRNDISQTTHPRRKQVEKSNEQSKKTSSSRKGQKRGKKSNTGLLHHLGMTKLRSPPVNHHRKRLASQSRKTHHQKNNIDSKMFVIKLPPNPYYYAHHDLNGYDIVEPQQPKSVNNVPVSFNTNGKPSKIYHWNIPVLKKMVARKAGSSPKSTIFADSDIFNIDKQATWNETDDDKSLYRKATYYGPKKQSKHTFRKYFAGNGKPHSFYVMEKSKKPGSVHRLLP